jgi:predicted DNA-binding transcriptional regulator YafY
VHASAEQLAARLPWVAGSIAPVDGERCEYRTSDDELEWLALRIVMLDEEVDVHEPPELVAMLAGLARRLQRATAGAG